MSFESRIEKHRRAISTCTERELFDIIEETGETIWVIDHEVYHGRMTLTPELKRQRDLLQAFIEEAVAATGRFGVTDESYWEWYKGMKYEEES